MTIGEEFQAVAGEISKLQSDVNELRDRAGALVDSVELISARLIKEKPEAAPLMQPILDQLKSAATTMRGRLQ